VRPDAVALDNPLLLAMVRPEKRRALAAIGAFDRTMALTIARAKGGDAILAQLRLAWWRDEIAALTTARRRPDPVLAALAQSVPEGAIDALAGLLDAWEGLLLAQPLQAHAAIEHAVRRGTNLAAVARAILDPASTDRGGVGICWAAVDLAMHIDDDTIRSALFDHAGQAPAQDEGALRVLRALDGWSHRIALRRGRPAALRDQLYLLRIGVLGR
jgi:phytoene synthase